MTPAHPNAAHQRRAAAAAPSPAVVLPIHSFATFSNHLACNHCGFASGLTARHQRRNSKKSILRRGGGLPPSPPPRIVRQEMLRFLFEKKLQKSDVTAAGRIVIPKRDAELHLPALESKEGFWIHLDDMDHMKVWTLKFRYWPNNCSRMYIFENTRNFISYHGLHPGDYLMVFKDDQTKTYVIRGRKKSGAEDDDANDPTDEIGDGTNESKFPTMEGYVSSSPYGEGVADQQPIEMFEESPHYQSKLQRSTSFDSFDFSESFFG